MMRSGGRTTTNTMIALALLADTQVTRAIHEADEARADARAKLEARLRREAAERARREEAARQQWESYDTRHRNAVNAVSNGGSGVVGGSILAGVLALVIMVVGTWVCTTIRLTFGANLENSEHFYGANGIGHTINSGLWLMVLVAVVCGLVARWVPIATWLTVGVIGWLVYESAPAMRPSDGIGRLFSDLVVEMGLFVLVFLLVLPVLLWLLGVTYRQADRARKSRQGLAKAQENLRDIEANPPTVERPASASGRPA